MAWIDLEEHPVINGQYDDGRTPKYSIDLPVKGAPLHFSYLGNVTIAAGLTEMEARKTRFEEHQKASVKNPASMELVGYVIDATGLVAYYQIRLPGWTFNPQQYANWPDTPPKYEDVP